MTQKLLDLKCNIARSQLSVALDLFIGDQDPIAVQCLACGGAEVIEAIAINRGVEAFSAHASAATKLKYNDIRKVRNKFWNACKHLTSLDGGSLRSDDIDLLSKFTDIQNDGVLFCGWYDYMMVKNQMPIEVQVFQAWYLAMHGSTHESDLYPAVLQDVFPNIKTAERNEQKSQLQRAIDEYRDDIGLLAHPKTEVCLLRD